ncbi:MAG: GAF domain-containing protein [Methanobacterium sp.]
MKDGSKKLNESGQIQCLMTEIASLDVIQNENSPILSDILQDLTLKEISDMIFNEAIKLTESDYCYIAYVDPENKDSVGISFSHLTDACKMYAEMGEARFKVLDDGTYGGLLGYSLDTGESFYVHDIASHPAAHGIPKGHEPVNQFLSVPVKDNEKILGQIVLANPKENYNDSHLEIAEKLADFYAIVLKEMLY